jgi:hypothetical protein
MPVTRVEQKGQEGGGVPNPILADIAWRASGLAFRLFNLSASIFFFAALSSPVAPTEPNHKQYHSFECSNQVL